jgi:AcrR family transcriptional regulator
LDGMQGFGERIMTATSTQPVPGLPETGLPETGPPVSLRERKKLATRRLLRRAALDLVAARGLSNVTVEDIAEAAEVSPRTFFNYFPTKEAALFGGDPDGAAQLRDRVACGVPGKSSLDVLRAVLAEDAEEIADEMRSLGGDPADWLRRMKVARTDPHVRAAHAAQMAMTERAIAEGLAARLGTDLETDPYPGVLAAAAVGAVRASMAFWAGSGGAVKLGQLIDQAFQALAAGLPENSDLRRITANVATADVTVLRKDTN